MFCMGMHSILVCAAAMWEQQKATEAILMLYIMISLFMLFPIYSGPGAPEITLESASGDSLTISWSVPSGTAVEMYELMWVIEGPQLQPVEIRNTVSSSTHRYCVNVTHHACLFTNRRYDLSYYNNYTLSLFPYLKLHLHTL